MYRGGKPQVHMYDELREFEKIPNPKRPGKMKRGPRKAWDAEWWRQRIIAVTKAKVIEFGLKEPIKGPIRVDEDFYFPRPGYMMTSKYPAGRIEYDADKNDRDNLDKLVLDAITQSGWYEDSTTKETVKRPLVWFGDGQVCQGEPQRWYCPRENPIPGARVVITRLREPDALLPLPEPRPIVDVAISRPIHPRLLAGRPKANPDLTIFGRPAAL